MKAMNQEGDFSLNTFQVFKREIHVNDSKIKDNLCDLQICELFKDESLIRLMNQI